MGMGGGGRAPVDVARRALGRTACLLVLWLPLAIGCGGTPERAPPERAPPERAAPAHRDTSSPRAEADEAMGETAPVSAPAERQAEVTSPTAADSAPPPVGVAAVVPAPEPMLDPTGVFAQLPPRLVRSVRRACPADHATGELLMTCVGEALLTAYAKRFPFRFGTVADLADYIESMRRSIVDAELEASVLVAAFEVARTGGDEARASTAALYQGELEWALSTGIASTPFVMPLDLQRQLRRVGQPQGAAIRGQVNGTIQEVLEQRARPVRCSAIVRMLRVTRAANARAELAGLRATRDARARLGTIPAAELAHCVDEAHAIDPAVAPYVAGELGNGAAAQPFQP